MSSRTRWADITAAAEKAVAEADAAIAERCRERGIPEKFRPSIHLSWWERGENACKSRRAELRKVAQTQVAARVKTAKVEIDRDAERQQTQLLAGEITSQEAKAFLASMPSAEQLLPPIESLKLPNGEIVELEGPKAERNVLVPVDRNGVTDEARDCNGCALCGKAIAPGRGRYCSNACRQAAYRQRQRAC